MADTGEMAGTTNASEVWRALQRLQNTATVLHTVAHPDDENGALLTWLSRGQGVRTALYSTTRGEGGANLIGPELFRRTRNRPDRRTPRRRTLLRH